MPLSEFLAGIRIAATMLPPSIRTAAPDLTAPEFRWPVANEGVWLDLSVVHGYSDDDFAHLPPGERTRLRDAVAGFRAVAGAVEETAPATREQAEAGLRQLLVVVDVLRPYLADAETERIAVAVHRARQADGDWVEGSEFRLGTDWSGDPAVYITLVLADDVDVESAAVQRRLARVRGDIRSELDRAGITRWPYVGVRWASETNESVAGMASA